MARDQVQRILRHQTEITLALSELLLHLLPFGNILHHADELYRFSVRIKDDIPLNIDRKLTSILQNQPVSSLPGGSFGQCLLNIFVEIAAVIGMNQIRKGLVIHSFCPCMDM
ncbi:hypothetical protein D3C84_1095950 [compost metagenome]